MMHSNSDLILTSLLLSNSLRCDFISPFFIPFSYLLHSPSSIFSHALGCDRLSHNVPTVDWDDDHIRLIIFAPTSASLNDDVLLPRGEVVGVGGYVNGLDRG